MHTKYYNAAKKIRWLRKINFVKKEFTYRDRKSTVSKLYYYVS